MPGTRRSLASRPSRKRLAAVLALLGVVAIAVGVALSWHFSSRVIVPDHSPWATEVEIVALADAGMDGQVYAGDPGQALGLPYREVTVRGELGPLPANECRDRSTNSR